MGSDLPSMAAMVGSERVAGKGKNGLSRLEGFFRWQWHGKNNGCDSKGGSAHIGNGNSAEPDGNRGEHPLESGARNTESGSGRPEGDGNSGCIDGQRWRRKVTATAHHSDGAARGRVGLGSGRPGTWCDVHGNAGELTSKEIKNGGGGQNWRRQGRR